MDLIEKIDRLIEEKNLEKLINKAEIKGLFYLSDIVDYVKKEGIKSKNIKSLVFNILDKKDRKKPTLAKSFKLKEEKKDWHDEYNAYMKDPLYAACLTSINDPKKYKKAISTLQSIRGWNAVTNINNLVTKVLAGKKGEKI